MLDLSGARRVLWSLLAGVSVVACERSAEVAIDPSPHDHHQRSAAPGAPSDAPSSLQKALQSSAPVAEAPSVHPAEAPSAPAPTGAPAVAARPVAPRPSAAAASEQSPPKTSAAPHAGAEHACGEGKCGG